MDRKKGKRGTAAKHQTLRQFLGGWLLKCKTRGERREMHRLNTRAFGKYNYDYDLIRDTRVSWQTVKEYMESFSSSTFRRHT